MAFIRNQVNYIMGMTGFHEFAEFVAEDVGTVDSGLNSMVRRYGSYTSDFVLYRDSDCARSLR